MAKIKNLQSISDPDINAESFWKNKLSPEQFNVCRLKGTEPPGSGKYNKHYEKGMYNCAACDSPLFLSETKYDSGTGWPSFWDFAVKGNIKTNPDNSDGMTRTEVVCAKCQSHLGHVFDDGPQVLPDGTKATGQRYCINSLALNFVPEIKK